MHRRYDLVIFDWDGTLMDSVQRIVDCWLETVEQLQLPHNSAEQVRGIIGLSMFEAIGQLQPQLDEQSILAFREVYRERYNDPNRAESVLFDGVEALLAELQQRGYKLAVATGKARPGLDHAFAVSGLEHYFMASRTACETASKPDPQMILELCQQCEVAPERTLMVGDAWFDLEMGRRAGADSVGVSYGAGIEADLMTAEPKAIIHQPLELLDWL